MTGRGIDQILPYPVDPTLYEPCVGSATEYVELAERASGPIHRPVDFSYVWGDALAVFESERPQVKLINLETAITHSDTPWPDKGINYRMSPANVACLTAAGIDCCLLANNHTLDWGIQGLHDTLAALDTSGIKHAGAGRSLDEAQQPAILPTERGARLIVFNLGSTSSGIPVEWAAQTDRAGLNLLEARSEAAIDAIAKSIAALRKPGDILIVSIHWGGNWGYTIPRSQLQLAHRLIDETGVDIVHGHSSHHVKAIEVYQEHLILYGCGDFINDYEGISGHEHCRSDLALMHFADLDSVTGKLFGLRMIPTQVRRFRVNRASRPDALWLEALLNREGKRFRTAAKLNARNILTLGWD